MTGLSILTMESSESRSLSPNSRLFEERTSSQEEFRNEIDVATSNAEDISCSTTILSIIWQGNKLGAAFYDISTYYLQLMADMVENAPSFPILKLLLKQLEPTCIVTSARTDNKVVEILENMGYLFPNENGVVNLSSTDSINETKLFLLPNIDFAFEIGKHRLKNLELPNVPNVTNEVAKQIYLSSIVDFANVYMVKATGGLLKFLEKNKIGCELDGKWCPVLSLTTLTLENIVTVVDNTFHALQIFQQERHPSVYKSGSGVKEGLSLFGLCNKCRSSAGKKELRRWFLTPTNDVGVIKKRHEAIKYINAPQNSEVTKSLQGCLKHIKNTSTILNRMRSAQASTNDWQAIFKTAHNALIIADICRAQSQSIEIFKQIVTDFSPDLYRIASLINKIVDFEESVKQDHFTVKPGISSELDNLKRLYNGLPNFMTKVAQQELKLLSDDIEECSVVYLPQLGYMLAISLTDQMIASKDYNIQNLDFVFVSNNCAHYKSSSTRGLDTLLGDTFWEIADKETEMMHKLQNVILEMSPVLITVLQLTSKLDCLIALALTAKENNYVKPEISLDGELHVIKGRHPLQELCVASYVPNDISSGPQQNKIKILTGPNSSGKSVYLKQVALIVYMAHIGSYVPAESAKIPMFDRIFSCLETVESVSINLSSFLIEINQCATSLNDATEKSLVVIDEFGNGTDTDCGLALLTSSLKYWIGKGPSSPHVFLTTHYHDVGKFLPPSELVQFQKMDTIKNDDLVYLYQLTDGKSYTSYAFVTSLRAGVPKPVVEAGLKVSEALHHKLAPLPSVLHVIKERFKRYDELAESFLRLDIEAENVKTFLQTTKRTPIASEPTSEQRDTTFDS